MNLQNNNSNNKQLLHMLTTLFRFTGSFRETFAHLRRPRSLAISVERIRNEIQ